MNQIATFSPENFFEIKSRGFIITGKVLLGSISIGNQVRVPLNNELLYLDIIAVESIRHANPEKIDTGLVIQPKYDQKKMNEIKYILKTLKAISIQ